VSLISDFDIEDMQCPVSVQRLRKGLGLFCQMDDSCGYTGRIWGRTDGRTKNADSWE